MVNFIRDHVLRWFWEGYLMREIWEGSEKVFWLRRSTLYVLRWFWEGFPFEKDLRSVELLQNSWDGFEIWNGSEKEIYPPLIVVPKILMTGRSHRNRGAKRALHWLKSEAFKKEKTKKKEFRIYIPNFSILDHVEWILRQSWCWKI